MSNPPVTHSFTSLSILQVHDDAERRRKLGDVSLDSPSVRGSGHHGSVGDPPRDRPARDGDGDAVGDKPSSLGISAPDLAIVLPGDATGGVDGFEVGNAAEDSTSDPTSSLDSRGTAEEAWALISREVC